MTTIEDANWDFRGAYKAATGAELPGDPLAVSDYCLDSFSAWLGSSPENDGDMDAFRAYLVSDRGEALATAILARFEHPV